MGILGIGPYLPFRDPLSLPDMGGYRDNFPLHGIITYNIPFSGHLNRPILRCRIIRILRLFAMSQEKPPIISVLTHLIQQIAGTLSPAVPDRYHAPGLQGAADGLPCGGKQSPCPLQAAVVHRSYTHIFRHASQEKYFSAFFRKCFQTFYRIFPQGQTIRHQNDFISHSACPKKLPSAVSCPPGPGILRSPAFSPTEIRK